MTLQATKNVKENFIVFSCNGRVKDVYKCDLTKDTDGKIDLNVNMICAGEVKDTDAAGVRSNLHLLTPPRFTKRITICESRRVFCLS
jgi:hypothetical protein